MKKSIFFAAFLLSTISFAQGTFKVSCQVRETLSGSAQSFEGTLPAQAKSPVSLVSAQQSEIKVSASYGDSAAAGPFDFISFNITQGEKTVSLNTVLLGSIGIVSMTETVSGKSPSVIICSFQQNQ